MDPKERMNDPLVAARTMLRGWQSNIWTALPAIVQSYDPAKVTVSAQPSIQAQIRDPKGNWTNVNLPVCLDCPVFWPGGGGYFASFPLAAGDEGALLFSSRCIDSWWQNGGVQTQAEFRLHNLSDGMFIPGLFSQKRVPSPAPSGNTAQLRNKDATLLVELNEATGIVKLKAPTKITLDAPVTEMTGTFNALNQSGGSTTGVITGNLHATGTLTGDTDVVAGNISGKSHKHGGVQPGNSQTTVPV